MQFNYMTLRAAIFDYTLEGDNTSNSSFISALPTIIGLAEDRVIRDMDPSVFDQTVALSATVGSPILPKPDGYRGIRRMSISANNMQFDPLMRKDKTWIDNYWRNTSILGVPLYYAMLDEVSFKLAPTPDLEYDIKLEYIKRPESISEANPVTWMSSTVGELLLYACLVEAMAYLREDPGVEGGLTNQWEARYQSTLASLGTIVNNQTIKGKYY